MNSPRPVCRILFLSANPPETSRVRLDVEFRDIQEVLKRSLRRDQFQVLWQPAARIQDLRTALQEHNPQIVHFSGHGAGEAGLVLEGVGNQATLVHGKTLERYFRLCPSVHCVLLNACYSEVQARAISQHVPYVIGMDQAIDDQVAIDFAIAFYQAIGNGKTFPEAYEWALVDLKVDPIVISRDINDEPESPFPKAVNPILLISQSTAKGTALINRQDYRNRQILLNKVRNSWIKGVLENSLHNKVMIDLGLKERLDLADPFNMVVRMLDQHQKTLPKGTQIIDVFDELGEGRTLLILGEPGSGKTIALLQLARDLLNRAEQDAEHLMPVVFNLSSWQPKQTIKAWLIEELKTKYQVPESFSKSWIQQKELLLLLDGLDEVRIGHRAACVEALNEYQQAHSTEMVVSCRIREYENLSARLNMQGAIFLDPLNSKQIFHYLNCSSMERDRVKDLIFSHPRLQELAKTPLMLNIMTLSARNLSQEKLTPGASIEDYQKHVFELYIKQMLRRRESNRAYSQEQAVKWLAWIAKMLTQRNETIFLIEQLQPKDLCNNRQLFTYVFLAVFLTMLWGSLVGGLFSLGFRELSGILSGALISGFSVVFLLEKITPQITFKWSWRKALAGALGGFLIGLISGFSLIHLIHGYSVLREFIAGEPTPDFKFIIVSEVMIPCILVTFLSGVIAGSRGQEMLVSSFPNQGIIKALNYSLLTGFICCSVLLGVFYFLISINLFGSLLLSSILGLLVWLLAGGFTCIKHFSLRCTLQLFGHGPWNYTVFLNQAVDQAILQRVGGGYIFIHRLLMEHFAQIKIVDYFDNK